MLIRQAVQSRCGNASSAMGPFYCPAGQRAYLDLGFFEDLARSYGAPGDFAQAPVLAHEIPAAAAGSVRYVRTVAARDALST